MKSQEVEDRFDASAEPRRRLTHALAFESRNALARVELAASELTRFDATPGLKHRIETIHEAVSEIDSLLGTIGALSAQTGPVPLVPGDESDLGEALSRALKRIESTLGARGVRLEVDSDEASSMPSPIPAPTLVRLLFAFLRLGLSSAERGDVVALGVVSSGADVRLDWRRMKRVNRRADLDRLLSLQLDVEAQWAEWGGVVELDESLDLLRLRIPIGSPREAFGE